VYFSDCLIVKFGGQISQIFWWSDCYFTISYIIQMLVGVTGLQSFKD